MSTFPAAPDFDAAANAILADAGAPLSLAPGAVIFRQGEPCAGYLIVTRGEISVKERNADGREIELYRVQPGQTCLQTAVCLMSGERYTAEGVATLAVEGILLSPTAFDAAMAVSAPFRQFVMRSLAARLRDFSVQMERAAFLPAPARAAAVLLAGADMHGVVATTHEQLAGRIGASRETISRILGEFERRGFVRLQRGKVIVADRTALERLSSGTD